MNQIFPCFSGAMIQTDHASMREGGRDREGERERERERE